MDAAAHRRDRDRTGCGVPGVSWGTVDELSRTRLVASERATAMDAAIDRAASGEPGPGTMIGRYVVIAVIGRGAMGLVLRAHDSRLHRDVALKLLRRHVASSEMRARMLREAQALAQLRHPNVVAVHDAEDTPFGVCIALEYVEGQDLRAWLAASRRSWREILAMLVGAGEGLAAAHEAGLIHRDVKPDNILVGSDGRPRMTDFGLARGGSKSGSPVDTGEAALHDDSSDDGLTREGVIMGTPLYMAPEQHVGTAVDGRADLFGLCVTTWEALFGTRPFAGGLLEDLAEKKRVGPPACPKGRVPGWVAAALVRGLAPRPADRWPSVRAWIDALRSGEIRARRRRTLGVVGVLGLGVVAALGGLTLQEHRARQACAGPAEAIGRVWDNAARERVRGAFAATGVPRAVQTADRVAPWLDRQAEALRVARAEVCLDHTVRETWDGDTTERALWCLDERRSELEALVDRLQVPNDRVVLNAVIGATGLAPVEPCRDVRALQRLPAPPLQRRDAIRSVRREVARASALARAGAVDEAHEVALAARTDAEELAWPPLTTVARQQQGLLLEARGRYEEAAVVLEDAFFEAVRAGSLELVADIAEDLTWTVGIRLTRADDARRWARHAEVALDEMGDHDGLARADYLSTLAGIDRMEHDLDSARTRAERALEIRERLLGGNHPSVAQSVLILANAHWTAGDHDAAEPLYRRALASWEATLGPDHPRVAVAMNNLANVVSAQGDKDHARALHEQALAIREASLEASHPQLAESLDNLGALLAELGNHDEAEARLQRALAIREQALGPAHTSVATSLHHLAVLHRERGELGEASRLETRALGIWEATHGPDHALVASAVLGLAEIALAEERLDDAVTLGERAVRIREANAVGPKAREEARAVLAHARSLAADARAIDPELATRGSPRDDRPRAR